VGYTCESYDDSNPYLASLKTSEERLKGMAKRCPGVGCMFYVEKDGGCDCIVCSQCGHEWIWDAVGFEGAVEDGWGLRLNWTWDMVGV